MSQKKLCYGIVLKTKSNEIVIIKRKVPYCIQNCFYVLHKKDIPFTTDSKKFQELFEQHYADKLTPSDLLDYQRFLNKQIFEDTYDFPHGHVKIYGKKTNIYKLFYEAYREFTEETGFCFDIVKSQIPNLPRVCLKFLGCDGKEYEQHYFIVDELKHIKRFSFKALLRKDIKDWDDDRLLYSGQVIPIYKAFEYFVKQQDLKADFKYLLCMKTKEIETMLNK